MLAINTRVSHSIRLLEIRTFPTEKQLCWFQYSAGKNDQDFILSLMAFPYSNICYWYVLEFLRYPIWWAASAVLQHINYAMQPFIGIWWIWHSSTSYNVTLRFSCRIDECLKTGAKYGLRFFSKHFCTFIACICLYIWEIASAHEFVGAFLKGTVQSQKCWPPAHFLLACLVCVNWNQFNSWVRPRYLPLVQQIPDLKILVVHWDLF